MYSIAIDGPAGSGKSTIAKRVAGRLTEEGTPTLYVDTGALYRALAYFCHQNISERDLENPTLVGEVCEQVCLRLRHHDGVQRVEVNGEDVTSMLRSEAVGVVTSKIAAYPSVRRVLLDLQRDVAKRNNVVMDGRDIGTCVLPDATVKIFLEASPEVRARRRYDELIAKGLEADLAEITIDMKERDERDRNRETAPLKQAADAVLIDTSDMTLDEVEDAICRIFAEAVWEK